MCAISQTTVCRLEGGTLRAISLGTLGRIVAVLGGLGPADPIPANLGLRQFWG